ncbi:GNAT family N-acetyltransferase [Nocardioides panacisoli]|uniref:GNAT family N-acetyltransferase n=1 Tax=Nocardioides panacisoli TaxID=627624 RepID=UPI001C62A65D|nr:GNAT family N-acetyltransferase [Nocardioides panacisoli]QYJ02831.1 GNAT family N-acetyltransferase [Nocardioides panacisoli]
MTTTRSTSPTALVRPDVRLHQSWAATVLDFRHPGAMHGSGEWHMPEVVATEAGCGDFVAAQLAAESADPAGTRVASTYYWIADGASGEVLGFFHLRHELNEWLLDQGGHIGYSVRPSRRREGHARRALAAGVRRAGALGIERVLVTCDAENAASRGTIRAAGGVLEDVRGTKERYWITVG